MIYLVSTLQSLIIMLCAAYISTQKIDLHIDSFELQVLDSSSSILIEKFNLIKVNTLTLEPNTKFHFKCTASGAPISYVTVKSMKYFRRNDTQDSLTSTSVDYIIETVDCSHSSDYTCQAGSMAGLKQIKARILIKCPVSEAKFTSNKKNHYVSVSNLQGDLMMACEDNDRPNSLSLYNQRSRSHRLNHTEHTTRVTYKMSSVKCEDMGTYICVVNKSKQQQLGHDAQDINNVTEVPLDVSVNNCPPRECHETIGNNTVTNISMNIIICVEVPIGTRTFGVFYNEKWVTIGNCKEGICLDCKKHDDSQFKHNVHVTFSNEDIRQLNDVMIFIGSGYNYKNNYMNYTIRFKHDEEILEPSSPPNTSPSNSTTFRATNETPQNVECRDVIKKANTWNTVLVFLCVFLLCVAMSLAVVVHFYRSKWQKSRRRPSRISQRLKFLAQKRNSQKIAENTTPKDYKIGDRMTSDGVYENTNPQNQYVNNGVKTFYVEPEPPNSLYSNVFPVDFGRYMNEEGLVYVTVHNSEAAPLRAPCNSRSPRRKVSYTEIDPNRKTKAQSTSEDSTEGGEHDIIYHNISGVF